MIVKTAEVCQSEAAAGLHAIAFSVPTGSDRLLAVGVDVLQAPETTVSVTWGGVPLTVQQALTINHVTQGTIGEISLWTLLAPATGTANVVITLSNPALVNIIFRSYAGVDGIASSQQKPKAPSTNIQDVIPSVIGGLVVDLVTEREASGPGVNPLLEVDTGISPNQVQDCVLQVNNPNGFDLTGGSSEPGAASVQVAWTGENQGLNAWGLITMALTSTAEPAPEGVDDTCFSLWDPVAAPPDPTTILVHNCDDDCFLLWGADCPEAPGTFVISYTDDDDEILVTPTAPLPTTEV